MEIAPSSRDAWRQQIQGRFIVNDAAINPKAKRGRRQAIRTFVLLVSIPLFPVTIWYYSPYLPFMGLMEGVVSGSLLLFATLFIAAIPFGRLFCGWVCQAGAIQHFEAQSVGKPLRHNWARWIKFLVWAPWAGGILALLLRALQAGKGLRPDFFYNTDHGISLTMAASYVIYGVVLFLVILLAVLVGKRGFCHTACWIAPFMVFGRGLGSLLRLPSLRLRADPAACNSCGLCDRNCPMSLPVKELVLERAGVSDRDCILCFQCADCCAKHAIKLGFDAKSGERRVGAHERAMGEES